jgi:kynurenine formamidase
LTAPRVTAERCADIFAATKQWGRWGDDDQRGALNLLTPELVSRAARLATEGRVVSCGRPLAVRPAPDNPRPAEHFMVAAGDVAGVGGPNELQGTADFVGVAFHGMAVSHIDALCHVFVDKRMYNGFAASDVTSLGARRNSIAAAFGGITGRGVLLDIPRLRGVKWLEPDQVVAPDELTAACAAENVELASGDVVLISTGRDARRADHGPWDPNVVGLAGLDAECIPWLAAKDLAVLGSDGVSDPLPASQHPWSMPVHMCLLVGMGVHLLDNLHLGRLATACEEEQRWEFLFTVAPLQIDGGTGSPVNPIAVL